MKRTILALLSALALAAGAGSGYAQDKAPLVLTLDECLRLALERNPSYLAVLETEPGAKSMRNAAAAQFFPSVDAQGTNILSKKPFEILFPSLVPGEPAQRVKVDFTRNYQMTLSFSLPLFAGGRLTAGYRQANFNLRATREAIRQARHETVLSVKKGYYGYLLARRFIEVSEEALALAEGHYKNVKNLAEVGMASKFDLLRSEVETANLKPQLLRARNALAVAELGLKTILGLDLDQPVEIRGELGFTPAELDIEKALEEALARRPDLAQVQLQRRMAGESLKIARGGGLPTLAVGGAYNTWADAFKFTKGTWEDYYSVSLVLDVPLFHGLRSHAQVGQSKALVRQLEHTQKGLAELVKFEVRQAVLNYSQARETLVSQEKNVDQAREAVRIAEINYREGLATNLDVSGAQVALSQALTNHAQALFDCAVALAEFEKAVGGGGNETESN